MTLDSFDKFTITVTPQSVLRKYTCTISTKLHIRAARAVTSWANLSSGFKTRDQGVDTKQAVQQTNLAEKLNLALMRELVP